MHSLLKIVCTFCDRVDFALPTPIVVVADPPPGEGFVTTTFATLPVGADVKKFGGSEAVSCVLLKIVGVTDVLLIVSVELGMKFVPLIVIVNPVEFT